MSSLLEKCTFPYGIKSLSLEQKEELAQEVREKIIQVVSKNGGHLAPSLGTVDLTIALLSVFDSLNDKIIWDVGHQAYAWKILTDRNNSFDTLRTYGGISGFTKPEESPYDHFIAGHASTSISAALGKAYARDLKNENNQVIAIIGDGALTGGMAYEALNQAGELGKRLIVILNDNNMSISPNVGALSRFISSNLSSSFVLKFKTKFRDFCYAHPKFGRSFLRMLEKGEQSFKSFLTPGSLFEAFDFNYIGPVDGHNIEQLILHLQKSVEAQQITKPILLHVKTIKGKGYQPAENAPSSFHAVSPLKVENELVLPINEEKVYISATKAFSQSLMKLAENDNTIVPITAAMLSGTGLADFAEKYPDRCVDVGICEQHAVTFAAGLASEGYTPIVSIYSTFLQRAYDQIVHDVCLQNLHVIFCIDRAGLVGEDGATHHGVFDLTFLRSIPNMHILVPTPIDMLDCLATAISMDCPIALRYPRGKSFKPIHQDSTYSLIPKGVGEFLLAGDNYEKPIQYTTLPENIDGDLCIIAVGTMVAHALEACTQYYCEKQKTAPIFNARWVKPLPTQQLDEIAEKYSRLIIAEENTQIGGFSSAILEYYSDTRQVHKLTIERVALPDAFVEHGKTEILENKYRLTSCHLLELIEKMTQGETI